MSRIYAYSPRSSGCLRCTILPPSTRTKYPLTSLLSASSTAKNIQKPESMILEQFGRSIYEGGKQPPSHDQITWSIIQLLVMRPSITEGKDHGTMESFHH